MEAATEEEEPGLRVATETAPGGRRQENDDEGYVVADVDDFDRVAGGSSSFRLQ